MLNRTNAFGGVLGRLARIGKSSTKVTEKGPPASGRHPFSTLPSAAAERPSSSTLGGGKLHSQRPHLLAECSLITFDPCILGLGEILGPSDPSGCHKYWHFQADALALERSQGLTAFAS